MSVKPEILAEALPTTISGSEDDLRRFPGCYPEVDEIVSLFGAFSVGITNVPGQPIVRSGQSGQVFEVISPAYSGYFLKFLGTKGCPIEVTIAPEASFIDGEESTVIIVDCFVNNVFSHHHVLVGYRCLQSARNDLEVLCPAMYGPLSRNVSSRVKLPAFRTWLQEGNLLSPYVRPTGTNQEIKLDTSDVKTPHVELTSTPNGRRLTIVINGPIAGWNANWQKAASIITELESTDTVVIGISSPGGNTQTAFTFMGFMELCQARVITVALGHCASAAPVIWSAGKERYLTDAAGMMVHSILLKTAEQLPVQKHAEFGDFCKDVTYTMLRKTVGAVELVTPEEIKDVVEKSTEIFMTASEVAERTQAPILHHGLKQILGEG